MAAMEERTSKQLSALAELGDLLENAGIAYWLFGGWAVDFYAGAVTRTHDDLDVAVWEVDGPAIARLLTASGWRHATPLPDEDGGTGYERGVVRLELTFLVRTGGHTFIPLRSGPVEWLDDELAVVVRDLHGVRTSLVSLAPLTRGKSSPRSDPDDAAKDRADFEQLSRLVV
jgi:hypothetical protein